MFSFVKHVDFFFWSKRNLKKCWHFVASYSNKNVHQLKACCFFPPSLSLSLSSHVLIPYPYAASVWAQRSPIETRGQRSCCPVLTVGVAVRSVFELSASEWCLFVDSASSERLCHVAKSKLSYNRQCYWLKCESNFVTNHSAVTKPAIFVWIDAHNCQLIQF